MAESAVRMFDHSLTCLSRLVKKLEDVDPQGELLEARLAPDMLPLVNQIKTAANFPLRACCPLVGRERVSFESTGNDYTSLLRNIERTMEYMQSLPALELDTPYTVSDTAGFRQLSLPPQEYLYQYALPNFYFHLAMVYAIARAQGVALSKGDFDGYHQYPPGFSFER